MSAVVIALIADFIWHVAKAAIDSKLAETADLGQPNTDEARRRARLRTLLPIFRNILFVVVVVVAAMMALAAMGVEIGPLIAGASVLGVAIGFGAQTFVRDVIAGMFYLLDDAFRVGEYIQSRQLQGHGRRLQPPLGQAAAPARAGLHRAVQPVGRGSEHEPRLGHRQDHGRRHL